MKTLSKIVTGAIGTCPELQAFFEASGMSQYNASDFNIFGKGTSIHLAFPRLVNTEVTDKAIIEKENGSVYSLEGRLLHSIRNGERHVFCEVSECGNIIHEFTPFCSQVTVKRDGKTVTRMKYGLDKKLVHTDELTYDKSGTLIMVKREHATGEIEFPYVLSRLSGGYIEVELKEHGHLTTKYYENGKLKMYTENNSGNVQLGYDELGRLVSERYYDQNSECSRGVKYGYWKDTDKLHIEEQWGNPSNDKKQWWYNDDMELVAYRASNSDQVGDVKVFFEWDLRETHVDGRFASCKENGREVIFKLKEDLGKK